MKTIAERLAAAMLQTPDLDTQYALSAKTGVPQPTILRILSGTSKDPRATSVKPLADALGVNYQWLREGVGLSGNSFIDGVVLGASYGHLSLVSDYESTYNIEAANGPHRSFLYPEISEVAAGSAMEAIDLLQPGEGERHQSDAWAGTHGFWLRVKGDSMTTSAGVSFPQGMLVLVSPDEQPESGKYIVAKIGNDVTLKQYIVDAGVRYLKPLNPSYQQQIMDHRWSVVGTVVDAKWPKSIF